MYHHPGLEMPLAGVRPDLCQPSLWEVINICSIQWANLGMVMNKEPSRVIKGIRRKESAVAQQSIVLEEVG